ncbi:MAG: peptidoglycan DD-metalloendopeptidase family protein [Oscillospiraceae bacterium]|nr:peptidoglycan DD-metalloendopeptidase family protein [Oscillospiraceae bacterium]
MFLAHIRAGLWAIFNFLQFVGRTVAGIIKRIFTAVFGFIFAVLSRLFKKLGGWLSKKFKQPLYDIWCFVLTPFAHAFGRLDHTRIQFRKAKRVSRRHAGKVALTAVGTFFRWLGKALVSLFNYAAPVVCIVFFISLVRYASSITYSVSVEYNGNDLGVISSEADYSEAQALVQDKITYTSTDEAVIATPTFTIKVASEDDDTIDVDSLSELMIESADANVVDAYGFYVNGTLIGVYDEEEMLKVKTALENKLAEYYTPNAVSTDFSDDVEIIEGRYIEDNLTLSDIAVAYINGSVTVEAYYIVGAGDTLSSIASTLGYTTDELLEENPLLSDGVNEGDIVTYHYDEPNLSVVTTYYENYYQVVERETRYVYDSSMEEYNEILRQSGSDGYEHVTALVTETNGVETDRTITTSYTIIEMVPRIFVVGTAENTTIDDTSIIDLLGTFCWPVGGDGGYVSSTYGWRSWDSATHYAIDIAADYGTDIYAACSGTVTFASTYGAYGKLVIIDCGYGYEAYYGHMSSIDVSEGDVVEKGDVIGHVGMTGSASGNHLHFEMRYNDDRFDPIYVLGGYSNHEVRDW